LRIFLPTLAAAIAVITIAPRNARPQSAAEFDVASIHLNRSAGDGATINTLPGGRFRAANVSLKALVQTAFGVRDFQVTGGPRWLDTTAWDIEARSVEAAPGDQELSAGKLRPLLQALLASRFQLRFHRETREGPMYSLTVAKGGSKLMPHTGTGGPSGGTLRSGGKATMKVSKVTIANLAEALSGTLDRAVADNTGLHGEYDFTLEWAPDQSAGASGPSIFTALQEQLGLKLESVRGPVETIVIDSAERASEN
jgi:uncharacterized protein (TIGR03435 family)